MKISKTFVFESRDYEKKIKEWLEKSENTSPNPLEDKMVYRQLGMFTTSHKIDYNKYLNTFTIIYNPVSGHIE